MAHFFTQKQIDEYKECFLLYDRSRKGYIRGDDLVVAMRSLDAHPTVDEIKQYRKEYEHGGKVKFDDFLQIMYKHQEDPLKEILEAFRVSDPQDRGFIMANEFRHIMTRFGERLTDKEVDAVLREFGVQKTGFVKYKEITKQVLRPIPDTLS
ncbi:calmodulin-like protein 4 [Acanthaster planci]|uniref:Calmodulin-like protein 4 n=1 Tax=Acanthaster planci TaxID=133434 RepID=A0A8B7Z2H4_ACAPL|nr:calmodulin-like protein 4 [Acanthaster planci]